MQNGNRELSSYHECINCVMLGASTLCHNSEFDDWTDSKNIQIAFFPTYIKCVWIIL